MHGFANLGKGSKVHHRIDGMRAEQAVQQVGIAQVSFHEFSIADEPTIPGGQIVQGYDRVLGFVQLPHHVRADVTGPANNQNRSLSMG
ncbi:hypothetical protein DSCW_04430 [Desulfosarcina widdelii]|uniref:Uncharacterized protein n=1 Tax=Desulfosarcina widdelii TaxID=947919 RepID=A0A5K7YUQ8_9BACT|nr:hypothetical protein DSCW_04430 [Desulfosarcina widdelii]